MQTTADFIEALKAKHGLKSNYAVAKFLNQTDTAVARWSKGSVTFSDEMAMHMAELLDFDPAYVVACVHAERAKTEAEKKLWERISNIHYAIAATIMLALIVSPALPWDNSLGLALAGYVEGGSLYIMSNGFWLYWWILPLLVMAVATLALLAFPADPRHPPRPQKEAEKFSNVPPELN